MDLDKKPHLIKWAIVCSDKKERGLGIRGFYNLNKALLSKWLWHIANERDSLWRKVSLGGWCLGIVRGPFRTGVWKEIINEWEFFPLLLCAL